MKREDVGRGKGGRVEKGSKEVEEMKEDGVGEERRGVTCGEGEEAGRIRRKEGRGEGVRGRILYSANGGRG